MKLLLIILFFIGLAFLLGAIYFSLKTFAPPSLNENLKDHEQIKISRTDSYMIWVETKSFSAKPYYFDDIALLETKTNTIIPVDFPEYRMKHLTRHFKVSHLLYTFNATPGRYRLLIDGELSKKGRYYLKPSTSLLHFLSFIFALIIGLALCILSTILFITFAVSV